MAATPTFDAEIGMWTVPDHDSAEDALAREAEELDVEHRAAAVAQAVADEVAALTYQLEPDGAPQTDWVSRGNVLLDEISRQVSLAPVLPPGYDVPVRGPELRRPRQGWSENEGVQVTCAPWGILLSTALPLGVDWRPCDMLRLRSTCYALRTTSTSQFFLEVLATLGVPLRPHVHEAKRLFHFASRVFSELEFVHSLRGVAAGAVGLRTDSPDAADLCCVAGSHALNRMLLLDPTASTPGASSSSSAGAPASAAAAAAQRRRDAARQGHATPSAGVPWTAGDIDIFVGCRGGPHSPQSVALYKAVVQHAADACRRLYSGSRMAYLPLGWAADHVEPRVSPRIKHKTDSYSGLGNHPASVVDALGAPGATYERDAVLALAHADNFPRPLVRAISKLPPTLGTPRPLQIERVAEIHPFQYPFNSRSTQCSHGPSWPMPMKLNVIQYSHRHGGPPLRALQLADCFDLVPARVVMRVDASLAVSFDATQGTRECVRTRELRLSRYAFGPAADLGTVAVEEAISKQLQRVLKYETYGFAFAGEREQVAGTGAPVQ